MKYYIIAGEASGDIHGANLIKEIIKLDPQAEIRCWGGDKMETAGGTIVKHFRDLAFMGFVEVLKNIRTILGNISFCKKDIEAFNPDKIVYIDYPGFNLRIADWAKKKNFKNHYYISPQLWAWKEGRIKKIKKVIDQMYVILPFEKPYYANHNYDVQFVGHPLIDEISTIAKDPTFLDRSNIDTSKHVIALLPGSRKQEITKMLSIMLSISKYFDNYEFVIAGAPSIPRDIYRDILKEINFTLNVDVKLVENETYQLLQIADAALVTSGTATLETALFNVPQAVCYKGNAISVFLAKRLIKIKYISLVNLILDKTLVDEIIQEELTTDRLVKELQDLVHGDKRERVLEGYSLLKEKLGGVGASKNVALLLQNN